MENSKLTNSQDIMIQGLLDRFLRVQSIGDIPASQKEIHLDEDTLAAFTEGTLTEREVKPVISHLVDCSFCRHVTKELVRLDLAFAENEIQTTAVESQPAKISEVLGNLLSRIFGTNDNAVFAHQEEETEKDKDSEKKQD